MSFLTIRAERALIGALLDDTHRDTDLSYLRPDDFGHRAYRQLYTTIHHLRATEPHLYGTQFIAAVAAHADLPGIDVEFLADLATNCPNTDHLTAYAGMIQAAAFRRDVAEHATRIAATVTLATNPDQRALLAEALHRQAALFADLTSDPTDQTLDQRDAADRQPTPAGAGQRAELEDQILADLLRHPEQALDLARFLPSDTFTSPQRQELYETMLTLASEGDAIDEIIVAWEHARLHAFDQLTGTTTHTEQPAEPTDTYLARLASTTITIPSAIETGRDLLAADTRAALHAGGRPAIQTAQTEAVPAEQTLPQHDTHLRPPAEQSASFSQRLQQ